MRPAMIRVQQPNPQPVLVVQQQVPVVRQPQAQLSQFYFYCLIDIS